MAATHESETKTPGGWWWGGGGLGRRKRADPGIRLKVVSRMLHGKYGSGSKLKSSGKPRVLVFGGACQGAILVHVFEPQPYGYEI